MLHSLPGTLPHLILELAAYVIGARLYFAHARRVPSPPLLVDRLTLLAGAIFGAFIGSKALHVAEHLPALLSAADWRLWLGGKSILGGFLGGTLGVEIAKRGSGWNASTGDAWVPALAVGLIIGRIGCQLSGLWDLTFGSPTRLPWAWDYGDGIGRHPTALYEIVAVALLWAGVASWSERVPGAKFAAFLGGYCAIRFALEFMKPPFGPAANESLPVALYSGLTAIQWAAVAGCIYFSVSLKRRLAPGALPTA